LNLNHDEYEFQDPAVTPESSLVSKVASVSLRGLVTGLFASTSSLSLPVVIIVYGLQPQSQQLSLFEKILVPMVPYAALLACRAWLVSNGIIHRLDGRVDQPINQPLQLGQSDHCHVMLALCANLSSISNAVMVVLLSVNGAHPAIKWPLLAVSILLNFILDLYTDVVDSFRKHVEYHAKYERVILPLFRQPLVRRIYQCADLLAPCIRELLPIFRGFVRSRSFMDVIRHWFPHQSKESMACNYFLASLIYLASAYSCGFELIQLQDNITSMGKFFSVNNVFSQSANSLVRCLGHTVSGKILLDVQQLCLSKHKSFYLLAILSMMGTSALIMNILTVYLSSNDAEAVIAQRQGLVMQYYAGQARAIEVAPALEIGMACSSLALGSIGVFTQLPTLWRYSQALDDLSSTSSVHSDEVVDNSEASQDAVSLSIDRASPSPV